MRAFLQVTKEAVGYPICDVILITGNTEVYSNAWNAVIGKPTHRLMCAWHIDCAWIKNLKHFFSNKAHGTKWLQSAFRVWEATI